MADYRVWRIKRWRINEFSLYIYIYIDIIYVYRYLTSSTLDLRSDVRWSYSSCKALEVRNKDTISDVICNKRN